MDRGSFRRWLGRRAVLCTLPPPSSLGPRQLLLYQNAPEMLVVSSIGRFLLLFFTLLALAAFSSSIPLPGESARSMRLPVTRQLLAPRQGAGPSGDPEPSSDAGTCALRPPRYLSSCHDHQQHQTARLDRCRPTALRHLAPLQQPQTHQRPPQSNLPLPLHLRSM